MKTRKHFTLIDASLHTLKYLSLPKTFNPLNKTQNSKNHSEQWQESLTDKLKRFRRQKPELLLQAGKRQTVGHAVGGSKSQAKKSMLAVLALKRRNCNTGSILLKRKKKSWQKLPSSLKSEGFENVLISTRVATEICLFSKISYWSEEATHHLRRKAAGLR